MAFTPFTFERFLIWKISPTCVNKHTSWFYCRFDQTLFVRVIVFLKNVFIMWHATQIDRIIFAIWCNGCKNRRRLWNTSITNVHLIHKLWRFYICFINEIIDLNSSRIICSSLFNTFNSYCLPHYITLYIYTNWIQVCFFRCHRYTVLQKAYGIYLLNHVTHQVSSTKWTSLFLSPLQCHCVLNMPLEY